jgi:hypothetical protein
MCQGKKGWFSRGESGYPRRREPSRNRLFPAAALSRSADVAQSCDPPDSRETRPSGSPSRLAGRRAGGRTLVEPTIPDTPDPDPAIVHDGRLWWDSIPGR